MDDLEERIRESLARMADDAPVRGEAPERMLRKARLGMTATAVVGAVVLMAAAISVWAGIRSLQANDTLPKPADSGRPSPSVVQRVGDAGLKLFLAGRLRHLGGPEIAVLPSTASAAQPVDTPFGTLIVGGPSGDPSKELWLVSPTDVRTLASNAEGVAASADGSMIAYAHVVQSDRAPHFTSTLRLASPDGKVLAESAPLRVYARVMGFVGERVVAETGDGATASAGLWQPGDQHVQDLGPYGSVVATAPRAGVAAFNEGDGTCWVVIDPTRPTTMNPTCPLVAMDISPDGDQVAGLALDKESSPTDTVQVKDVVNAGTAFEATVPGVTQIEWEGNTTLIVLSVRRDLGSYSVMSCTLGATCDALIEGRVPAGTPEFGGIWLVEPQR